MDEIISSLLSNLYILEKRAEQQAYYVEDRKTLNQLDEIHKGCRNIAEQVHYLEEVFK